MPYQWIDRDRLNKATGTKAAGPAGSGMSAAHPIAELHLWPHRSLPRRGFVAFISATALLMCLPLILVLGTPVLWGLLPFLLLNLAGIWCALSYSYRTGQEMEELRLWPDRVSLTRHCDKARSAEWVANPHWVQVQMYHRDGPVTDYVTLRGGGREVEIGAFLSEAERRHLFDDLNRRLGASCR